MKKNWKKSEIKASSSVLNAYDHGFRTGINIALEGNEMDIKKINPFNSLLQRACWEAFRNGARDGFLQGVRQREQHKAFVQLKETEKLREKQSKESGMDLGK